MADRVVRVRLSAQVSDYEKGMLAAARATRNVGSEAEKLQQKREAFESIGRAGLAAGAALTAASVLSVKAAMGWESAWAGVTKTVEGTPEELAKVEDGLRKLTGVLPASHSEIAAVAEAAGQLGISTGNVVEFTRTMIDLGETTNLSANDAATSLARFVNIMGTAQSEVSNLGSALVGLGNNYATTEAEIMEMAMRLAGAGKQIGLSEGQVLGLSTALSSVGIEAEAGGSAMSKVMIDIAASVEQGGDKLEKFATAAGMTGDQFAKLWRNDSAQALAAFVKGLANAESQGKSTLGILADLGITEVRMRDALLRSSAAADQFAGAMALGNEEFEKNNALTDEAAKRYETVESKLKIAGNAINDAAISFGSVLLPAVAEAAGGVQDLAEWFAELPEPVQGIITIGGTATGIIVGIGGAALLAVPKIAAFKLALEDLGLASSKASGRIISMAKVAAGAVTGLALAKIGTDALRDGFNNIGASAESTQNKLATAATAADVFAAAMGRGFGATDDIERVNQAVSGLAEMLDLAASGKQIDSAVNKQGVLLAVDAVDRLNGQLGILAETDLGAAQAAFGTLATEAGLTDEQILILIDRMPDWKRQLTEAATEARIAADAQGLVNIAMGEAGPASEIVEDGLANIEAAADEAARALDGTAQALDDIAGKTMTMSEAKDRALTALNAMAEAAKAEGSSLDGTNDASIRLRDSIREVEQASRDSADAIIQNGGSVEEATAAWEAGRKSVVDMRVAKGEDIETAKAWADENLGSASEVTTALGDVYRAWLELPENRETKYQVEKAEAEAALDALKEKLASIPAVKDITLRSYVVGNRTVGIPGMENANGAYYSGGVKSFASGGFEPGIYPYTSGGIHKFAEQYDEAYISMDPARRNRSEAVWVEAGRRMGFSGSQAGAPTEVHVIVQPKGGIDLLEYIDVRVEQSDTRLKSALRG